MNGMFPEFEAIPTTRPDLPEGEDAPGKQYYIRALKDGKYWFLWQGHDNGPDEWYPEDDMGRKKPMRFKTRGGADRRRKEYKNHMHMEIAEWKDRE
jgi:hypothetical protein